jgi:hypothetical protein
MEDRHVNQHIKVWLNFVRAEPFELMQRGRSVFTGLKDNPGFPNPPFDLLDLDAQIARYSQWVTEAADGSKKAKAESKRQRQILVNMLRELAHYVEANCKGDMTLFLTSGFEAVPTARTKTAPLSETIRSLRQGPNSGSVWAKLVASRDASSYQLRWAASGTEVPPEAWPIVGISMTRPPTLITGLTPGTMYVFQCRRLLADGYGDWSQSVTYLCT